MIFHIQCLENVLNLFMIVFPSAYVFFLKTIKFSKTSRLIQENTSIIIVYGFLSLYGYLRNLLGTVNFQTDVKWYILAFAFGIISICLEYFEAALPYYFRKKIPKLVPTALYQETFSTGKLFTIVLAAIFEEMIFRQFMISGLFFRLSFSSMVSIFLSGFFYSINHIYFGKRVVFQKFTTGLILSGLFIFSGKNICIPIICHSFQNILLYLYSFERKKS